MALTLDIDNIVFRDRWNDCLVRRALLTGPASYATGGIAIDNLGDFGWGETQTLQGLISDGTTYYGLFLDFANQKAKVVDLAGGVEVTNATDLSTFSGYLVATGK
jgi:hypothetical protein